MGPFERDFYKTEHSRHFEIEKFKKMPWFKYLQRDIKKGEIFPALRYGGSIHFYYKGARIYEYHGNTKGTPKVIRNKKSINHSNQNFYETIKGECKAWSKKVNNANKERAEISKLYRKFSPYIKLSPSMILLDIEIGFPHLCLDDQKIITNTQVDLLFLDKNTGMLYFIEVKEAGDSRIKRKYSEQSKNELYNSLKVAEQLEKYNKNLKEREDEILTAYKNYLDIMREVFGEDIYSGNLALYKKCKLLIYGKSNSDDSKKSLEAIRSELKDDLIVLDNGFDNIDDLPEKITTR